MVWAAGVRAPDMLADFDLKTNERNQIEVRRTLQTLDDDRIFALGDCCACPLGEGDKIVPPRAQSAHQMAATVYDNLLALMAGRELKSFEYQDHGSLVSLSRFSTVGSLMGNLVGGKMAVEGRLARFVYLSLYRMHLLAIHGWWRGIAMLLLGRVSRIARPRLKLH